MKPVAVLCAGFILVGASGCELLEIRSKSKFGPEFRTKGIVDQHNTRWTAQQGIELKWDQGVTTGVTYRRRDESGGNGDHDNGVWLELSFPLWKAKKKPPAPDPRLIELEQRVQELESRLAGVQ